MAIGFTGHRTLGDENKCRKWIIDFLARRKASAVGVVYGVSSVAAGGDLLFAESCIQLELPLSDLLPLPVVLKTLARASFVLAAAKGKSPYDLVLMDMVLGEGPDGLAVIEEIRRLFPEQKAILMSVYAPTQRVELAMRKGLIWLTKQCTGEALAKAVHAALSDG